jgi:hypothetical protein
MPEQNRKNLEVFRPVRLAPVLATAVVEISVNRNASRL